MASSSPPTLLHRLFVVLLAAPAMGAILAQPDHLLALVGVTGGTGARAVLGLLDVGFAPSQLRVLSRSPLQPSCEALAAIGVQVVHADLDDEDSLPQALQGVTAVYCHSTVGDTAKLETAEVERARTLAAAAAACGTVKLLVYNSAATTNKCPRVDRSRQKQDAEEVFRSQPGLPCTMLRATLFMEEFWKKYTRPSIIEKGKFPFAVPPTTPIYLASVRDMGRLAGTCFCAPETFAGRVINVASDVRTPEQIAAAFGEAQRAVVVHTNPILLYFFSFLFFRDLYQVIRFYRETQLSIDVPSLRREFPALLTPLADFLDETNWGDASLTYESIGQLPDLDS